MKNPIRRVRLLIAVGAVSCLPVAAAFGADTNTNASPAQAAGNQATPLAPQPGAPAVAAAPAAPETAPGKLPYGVADVLKLTQAQVGEEVVLNYVLNSGTVYNLGPKDIIYLRNQGVSDRVLTTMMNQRNLVAEESAQQAAALAESQAQGPPLVIPARTPPLANRFTRRFIWSRPPLRNPLLPRSMWSPIRRPSLLTTAVTTPIMGDIMARESPSSFLSGAEGITGATTTAGVITPDAHTGADRRPGPRKDKSRELNAQAAASYIASMLAGGTSARMLWTC